MLAGLLDRGLGEIYVGNFDQFEINKGRAYPHLVFRLRGNHEVRPFLASFLGEDSDIKAKEFVLGTKKTDELLAKAEPYLVLRKSQADIVRGFSARRLGEGEFYSTQEEYDAQLQADSVDAVRLSRSRQMEAEAQVPEVLDKYYILGFLAGRNYRLEKTGKRTFEPTTVNRQLAQKLADLYGGSVTEVNRWSDVDTFRWVLRETAFANFTREFEMELRYARAAGFPISSSFGSLLDNNERNFREAVEDRMTRLLPIVEQFSLLELGKTRDFTRVRLGEEDRYEHKADTLAEFLKLYRKDTDTPSEPLELYDLKSRVSQKEVAHRAYMNINHYSEMERGDQIRDVTYRSLVRLSVAMGMNEEESIAFVWAYYVPNSSWERSVGGQRFGPKQLKA